MKVLRCDVAKYVTIAISNGRMNVKGTAMAIDEKTRTELEAAVSAAWSTICAGRTDVQNIELMNLGRLLPQLPVELDEGRR